MGRRVKGGEVWKDRRRPSHIMLEATGSPRDPHASLRMERESSQTSSGLSWSGLWARGAPWTPGTPDWGQLNSEKNWTLKERGYQSGKAVWPERRDRQGVS